jgi:hypothetical protein
MRWRSLTRGRRIGGDASVRISDLKAEGRVAPNDDDAGVSKGEDPVLSDDGHSMLSANKAWPSSKDGHFMLPENKAWTSSNVGTAVVMGGEVLVDGDRSMTDGNALRWSLGLLAISSSSTATARNSPASPAG